MTGQRWYKIDVPNFRVIEHTQNRYEITEYYEKTGYFRDPKQALHAAELWAVKNEKAIEFSDWLIALGSIYE